MSTNALKRGVNPSYDIQTPVTAAPAVAIIGGSGFYELSDFESDKQLSVPTPYGLVEGIEQGFWAGQPVVFMKRHGNGHKIPPHNINYRANIWALKTLGIRQVIAINAVGGIGEGCAPGALVVPDQIIDYSYGREHTFADELTDKLNHIEFAEPYTDSVRQALLISATALALPVITTGCYACTQGPRLETAAEVTRLQRDGNTLVGMTAMPEAALARELEMQYGAICIVANWAAGLSDQPITLALIHQTLKEAVTKVQPWLQHYLSHSQSLSLSE
ncbi:S-methyl-5'-thioinosine phosphorylase [Marinagarivorans algicola]|uniref:S-methyl-5'-thioinosine phosphorylase n=1 Tax=Marinagarivorans algicola TaxID=1513270 RepID=UPI0009EB854D|nr:S-methyl-5'-thioinosine phosphorylase [Marinagarivorans algicola]